MNAKKVRADMETMIYDIMDIMDKSGYNTDEYKQQYKTMTDEQFFKHMKQFLNDEDEQFRMEIEPFNKKSMPKFKDLYVGAKRLGIELEEYVDLPYMVEDGEEIPCTPTPVPVGYLHIKRLQQMRSKKNKLALTAEKRDMRKGQVTGEDKGGFITDTDIYMLTAFKATATLKELCGARSDDMQAKEEQMAQIRKYGHTTYVNRTDDIENKQSLNTLNTYLMGAGLYTNLITDNYILPHTKKKYQSDITKSKGV